MKVLGGGLRIGRTVPPLLIQLIQKEQNPLHMCFCFGYISVVFILIARS